MTDPSTSLLEWLLTSLELDATVFHLGQYCNDWKASTSGSGRAAFHLVLHGACWLQLPGSAPLALAAGDVVFLLRDVSYALTPRAHDAAPELVRHGEMRALAEEIPGSVGLVCGFFEFRPGLSALLAQAFPEQLLVRERDRDLAPIRSVIGLIVAEARARGQAASALIEHLTAVLFLYLVRELERRDELSLGIFSSTHEHELSEVVRALVSDPARAWSIAELARLAGMSRATFCKHFRAAAGCSPQGFLLALRMQIAAQRLRRGGSVDEVAAHVGYQSSAAFARAFKRATGQQPGALRRRGSEP